MPIDAYALSHDAELGRINAIETAFDAVRMLRTVSRAHGLAHFLVMSFPGTSARRDWSISRNSTVSSLPADFSLAYDRLEVKGPKLFFDRVREAIAPVIYRVGEGESDPESLLLAEHQITTGLLFPVRDGRGGFHSVSFHGDRKPLTSKDIERLLLLSVMLIDRLLAVNATGVSPSAAALTGRELEMLRWTAEGKTSNEIAVIAGLSEHTVNHYVMLAMQKLGCSNRTQAVVHAIRQGLIG